MQLFQLRDGRLADRRSFYLDNAGGEQESEVLWGFAIEYYGGQVAIPPSVIVPAGFEDARPAGACSCRSGAARAVEVRAAQRGEKRRLVELATRNAEMALEHDRLVAQRTRARRVEALEELRERLNLESLPVRIECFDISNLGETNRVASMVVFEDAVAKRSDYRKFGIRHERGQDDFASMAEAVGRRFARMSNPTADEFDASFSTTPNLVVIDGGKGQLGAALKAMAEHDLPRVAVIALAKREEEVFLPGRAEPVLLERGSAGLQLLQRMRDEAHRFAIGFHRQRRSRSAVDSIFDGLPGVGPARRRVLMAALPDRRRAHRGHPRGAGGGAGAAAQGRPPDPRRRCTRPVSRLPARRSDPSLETRVRGSAVSETPHALVAAIGTALSHLTRMVERSSSQPQIIGDQVDPYGRDRSVDGHVTPVDWPPLTSADAADPRPARRSSSWCRRRARAIARGSSASAAAPACR